MPIEHKGRQRMAPGLAAPGRKRQQPKPHPKPEAENEEDDLFAGTMEDEGEPVAEDGPAAEDAEGLDDFATLDDFDDEGDGGELAAEDPPPRRQPPPKAKRQQAQPEEEPEAQLGEDPSDVPAPAQPQQQQQAQQQPPQQPQAGEAEPVTPQAQKLAERFRQEVQQAKQMEQGEPGEPEDYDTSEAIGLTQAGSMFELADSLKGAGFRLGLQNIRKQMLETLENFGLIAECKKIGRIPPEAMTSVMGSFVQGGKLIPAMLELGWKPVHKTGYNANMPVGEPYRLTMTNGSMFITVKGVMDWENNVNFTEIRYATDGELRQYGLLSDADDNFSMAVASAARPGAVIEYLPSVRYYGRATASSLVPLLSPALTAMRAKGDMQDCLDGYPLRHGDTCALPLAGGDGGLCRDASVLGLMPDLDNRRVPAAVLVIIDDGYALADPAELLTGVMQ